MGIFKGIIKWFSAGEEYKSSLADLVAYLPIGDLEALNYWVHKHIPYAKDVDENGNFDPLQNYNGADLTIKAKKGDCESQAAVKKEVISSPEWTAKGWAAEHIYMAFIKENGDKSAHDVCYFTDPKGNTGWLEGNTIHMGDLNTMTDYYSSLGWKITKLYKVNDMGEKYEY